MLLNHVHFVDAATEPDAIRSLNAIAISSSSIEVTWIPPLCPYGDISRHIVFYRQSDISQTGNIQSEGFEDVDVLPEDSQYTIEGLTPYKNYTIHVQTVVRREDELFGAIERELIVRSLSDVGVVPTLGLSVINLPTSSTIDILIGDPTTIDTGRVM